MANVIKKFYLQAIKQMNSVAVKVNAMGIFIRPLKI